MKLSERVLDELAKMVVGDAKHFPYRSSSYITRFFRRCDLPFVHDGLGAAQSADRGHPSVLWFRLTGQFFASLILSAHLFLMRRVGVLSRMLSVVSRPRSIDHVRMNSIRLLGAHAQMRKGELGWIRKSGHALVPVSAG